MKPVITLLVLLPLAAEPLTYPQTRKAEHVDTYHGVAVLDPYRWMEDDRAPEVAAWVQAQNEVTRGYFAQIPYLPQLRERLRALSDYPKYSAPFRRGPYVFFNKNEGLQNQPVIYVQQGETGTPRMLIDPNKLSANGTSRIYNFSPSRDGKLAAYAVSEGGSDWREIHVLETDSGKVRGDVVRWAKVTGVAWAGDGFFYSRYDAPAKGQELTALNRFHKVYFHRLGTEQAADALVYENRAEPLPYHSLGTTDDERFAILSITNRSTGKLGNAVHYRDLSSPGAKFLPLMPGIGEFQYRILGNDGARLLLWTDEKASNGRLVSFDTAHPERGLAPLVEEKPEPLVSASTAGGKLFLRYLKDTANRVVVHSLSGQFEREVALPGPGVVAGFGGERGEKQVFYFFTSMRDPETIYRYDIASGKSTVFRAARIPGYQASRYESKLVFATSKDGTKVPVMLMHRQGLKLDGQNPTLLYGYGGFNLGMRPAFSSTRLALLEQGFVYAHAALRGGDEYGEKWHRAGTKLQKQNVFDDYIAAAEWLVANKYTSPAKLAAHGVSNGGLLVGAVINQRPDLFRAAIPQAGVMDMLRFHKFTLGAGWISDYGSSDNTQEFAALRAYSPVHNIRGVEYPAVLVTTADHDDRVVPAHSFKYAAALQAGAKSTRPALIRIETDSGHGASSTGKMIEISSDLYAFLFRELGVAPKF